MASSCESKENANFDSSYAHVVYFWFNNPDNTQDKAFFETSLKKFLNSSKYAKTNFVGVPPKATRDVVDDSYTYNIILTFESAAAQEAYQKEDVHLQFIEESKHLWKKVIVYDAIPVD
jgi:hypothetical protein